MAPRGAGATAAFPAPPRPRPRARPRAAGLPKPTAKLLNRAVVVSALGYFVDIYDLLLFSIVRIPSLRGIGVPEAQLLDAGVFLLNMQMAGLLVGGLLWGVLGDKRGRVSVLFGSIFLYSIANLANAFVTDVPTYAALRFLAGVGLAGELGAAITLVSEVMTKESRGYGTSLVAGLGILGALLAGTVGSLFSWQVAYAVGGVMGLALLALRFKMHESGMFHAATGAKGVRLGDLRLLLGDRARAAKYARCILIGLPIWYVVGVLITFSPELARELGVRGGVSAGTAVMANYAAAAAAGIGSGFLSQYLRSRWWVIYGSLATTALLVFGYVFALRGATPEAFYALCFLLGLTTGYWAVFVTIASEQFGTNLRATVTTTVPNFIRGSVVPITLGFQALALRLGLVRSALVVGVACTLIALLALRGLEETYGKDLDYLEA